MFPCLNFQDVGDHRSSKLLFFVALNKLWRFATLSQAVLWQPFSETLLVSYALFFSIPFSSICLANIKCSTTYFLNGLLMKKTENKLKISIFPYLCCSMYDCKRKVSRKQRNIVIFHATGDCRDCSLSFHFSLLWLHVFNYSIKLKVIAIQITNELEWTDKLWN